MRRFLILVALATVTLPAVVVAAETAPAPVPPIDWRQWLEGEMETGDGNTDYIVGEEMCALPPTPQIHS